MNKNNKNINNRNNNRTIKKASITPTHLWNNLGGKLN